MMLIACPWCGERPHTEYRYHCVAEAVARDWASETPEEFQRRTWLRDNAMGWQREIWQHVHGCRGWLVVERHNRSHDIRAVTAWPGQASP